MSKPGEGQFLSHKPTIKEVLKNQAGLTPEPRIPIDQAEQAVKKIILDSLLSRKDIVKIITSSTLWNLGADSHQALSELTESLLADIKERLNKL